MRILILLFTAFISNAQHKANFKAAEKFSQANLSKMLKSTSVSPKWFEESDKFWYSYTTTSGKNFYVVDPAKRTRTKLFDNLEFSAKLSDLTRRPVNHNDLDLDELELDEDNRTLTFQIDSIQYRYDIYNKSLVRGDTIAEEEKNDLNFSKLFVKSSIGFFNVSGIKLPPNLPPQKPFLSCWSISGIFFLSFIL